MWEKVAIWESEMEKPSELAVTQHMQLLYMCSCIAGHMLLPGQHLGLLSCFIH